MVDTKPADDAKSANTLGAPAPWLYEQEEHALRVVPDHFLNELSNFGFFKPENKQAPPEDSCGGLTRLFCCLNVSSVSSVNASEGTFSARVRLYLVWQEDLAAVGLAEFAQKAADSGEKYGLSRDEVRCFESTPELILPDITFFNAVTSTAIDEHPSIRVYRGAVKQTLMWNQGFSLTCREHFELADFCYGYPH